MCRGLIHAAPALKGHAPNELKPHALFGERYLAAETVDAIDDAGMCRRVIQRLRGPLQVPQLQPAAEAAGRQLPIHRACDPGYRVYPYSRQLPIRRACDPQIP